jgi:hypothetical protein
LGQTCIFPAGFHGFHDVYKWFQVFFYTFYLLFIYLLFNVQVLKRLADLRLLLLLTCCSTKPPEANTATKAPLTSQSIHTLPLYTLTRSSHFPYMFPDEILLPYLWTIYFSFCQQSLAICLFHPQNVFQPSHPFLHYALRKRD